MALSASDILAIVQEVISVGTQIYEDVSKNEQYLKELWSATSLLINDFIGGKEITEDDVTALRAQIAAINADCEAKENAIINGTAS